MWYKCRYEKTHVLWHERACPLVGSNAREKEEKKIMYNERPTTKGGDTYNTLITIHDVING